jgi:CDP-L-myo-inositol myo-inositolphosphotransferase
MEESTKILEQTKVVRALVLAAGEGSRMDGDTPKPLKRIAGLTLLERVLHRLQAAGIMEVHLVVGYKAKLIQQQIGSSYAGLNVRYIHAKNWEKGNLYSFLAARSFSDQDFILCMGDHIFDPEIVQKLQSVDLNGVLILAVDRTQHAPDDTLVLERNGRITNIGKNIKESNCVDIGIFKCSPKVFKYALNAANAGGTELAESVKLASVEGKAQIMDISRHYWIDVDSNQDVKRAKHTLAQHTQKGRGASDFIAHYINQPIEKWLTYHLSDTWVTPNTITVAVNILAYVVAALFLFGYLIQGALLTFVVGVMDGVDGKLARIQGRTTRLGKLEHTFDLLFEFTWLLVLGTYHSAFLGVLPVLLAASSIILIAFYRMIYDLFSRTIGVSLDNYGRFEQGFRRVAGRRNLYNLHILVGVVLGLSFWSLVTILLHAAVTAFVYAARAGVHLRAADRRAELSQRT